MKFITRFLCVPVAGLLALTSCAKDEDESYVQFENQALEAWMTQHRSDLVQNYQSDGGYYIDVIEAGDQSLDPIGKEPIWVSFDFTGRDLAGNIILTRNADSARLAGTFSKYTHYVPFYRYCGTENTGLMEGTWLAMRNTLKLGEKYYNANKDRLGLRSPELRLRYGTKIQPLHAVVGRRQRRRGHRRLRRTVYAEPPSGRSSSRWRSAIRSTTRSNAKAGMWTGSATTTEAVWSTARKPTTRRVPSCVRPIPKMRTTPTLRPTAGSAPAIPFRRLYVNVRYDPTQADGDCLTFSEPYKSVYEPYDRPMAQLDKDIAEALKKRFYPDEDDKYEGVVKLEADSVTLDGTAKIWYIGRFLDGFIFDTNIDEVKKIIYGEVKSAGSALSYKPSERNMIEAFYYTIPNLKYGQWAGDHHLDQRLRFVGQDRIDQLLHVGHERLFVELLRLPELSELFADVLRQQRPLRRLLRRLLRLRRFGRLRLRRRLLRRLRL